MSTSRRKTTQTRRAGDFALAIFRVLAVVLLMITGSLVARAQDPTSSPEATPAPSPSAVDQEIERLKKEKEKAELKKAIRDAQPQTSATPLEGKTTVDENVIIETQMVTYKAMSDVAERIGSEIHSGFPDAKSIAIYNAEELQNLKHYRAAAPVLNGRIDGLKDQYEKVFNEIEKYPELQASAPKNSVFRGSNRESAKKTITSLSADLDMVTAPSEIAAGAGTALKAFADLLALMRTDTEIKGKSVTVEESAMVAETFRALRTKFEGKLRLYYPAVVQPEADFEGCPKWSTREFCSPILTTLAGLYEKRADGQQRLFEKMFDVTAEFDKMTRKKNGAGEEIAALSKKIDELNFDRLQQEMKKPWTLAQVRRFERFIKGLEARKADALAEKTAASTRLETLAKEKNLLESLQALNQQADDMVAALAKPDDKGKSELASFLRAENMDKAMGNDGYWLEFKSVSAGGNNRTRKNLFRYFSGAKLDHSGGIIIEWALYDRNGASVESNKDSSYPGYFAPKQIQSGKLKDAVVDPGRPAAPAVAKTGNQ